MQDQNPPAEAGGFFHARIASTVNSALKGNVGQSVHQNLLTENQYLPWSNSFR